VSGLAAALLAALIVSNQPPIRVEADSSFYDIETRRILLEGHVRLERAATVDESELIFFADRIEGRLDGPVEATGDIRILYSGREIRAARGEYDFALATGRFEELSLENDSWFVTAASARLMGMNRYRLEEVRLTACDETPPHYHFRVGRAEFRDNRLIARGLWMYIGRTPVAWFPWLTIVPGRPRPPVRIRVGRTGFEGYYVKLAYLYDLGRLGEGDIKLDWRSRRGWGYGVEHEVAIPRGRVRADLYRIDERQTRARGVARGRYEQDLSERLRALGEIHYVTDEGFRRDYRFKDFVSEPDPQSGGAVTWRGEAGAFMVRAAANANRSDYNLVERLPEARLYLAPRRAWFDLQLDADASITAFRHSHPRESGAVAWNALRNPGAANRESLVRWNARTGVRRPTPIGAGWIMTPFAGLEALGIEDSFGGVEEHRFLPSAGLRLATFRRYRFGENLSWSIRPAIEFEERGLHGGVARPVIIEHIDQRRDARFVKLVLDQGMLGRRDGVWRERLRVRLDGGIDLDRVSAEKWLPVVGRVNALFGRGGDLEGELNFDPNRNIVRQARFEARWAEARYRGHFGWRLRRGDYGVDDQENIDGGLTTMIGASTELSLAASYSRTMGRLDFARAGIKREYHCWILGLEVTDYRPLDRFDIRATAELKFP
jgi:hypothetical protein